MYLPIDPLKTESILQNLENYLSTHAHVYSIVNGKFISGSEKKTLSTANAADFVDRLRGYQYVRVGTSRLQPTPPHFGIDYLGSNVAELKELISLSSDRKQLLSDISKVVQLFFFQDKQAVELRIPFSLSDLLVDGFTINLSEDGKSMEVRVA